MILCPHGKPFVGWVEARAPGNGPAQQYAVQLKPEIIVEAPGVMFLDEIGQLFIAGLDTTGRRFRRGCKVALTPVFFERHSDSPDGRRRWTAFPPADTISDGKV
jgi:hypothetical protein